MSPLEFFEEVGPLLKDFSIEDQVFRVSWSDEALVSGDRIIRCAQQVRAKRSETVYQELRYVSASSPSEAAKHINVHIQDRASYARYNDGKAFNCIVVPYDVLEYKNPAMGKPEYLVIVQVFMLDLRRGAFGGFLTALEAKD